MRDVARRPRSAQAVRHRPAGGGRRELPRPDRRDRGAARALRLRQDHDAALRRRPRASHGRAHQHRRAAGLRARRRRAGAAAAAQHRHGVPVLRGLAAHDGAAERGLSAAPPPRPARRDRAQDRRRAGAGRAVGVRASARWCRSRAGRCSAWRWRAASSTSRSSCCSTSRSAISTRKLRLRLRDDLRRIIKQTGVTARLRHPRPGRGRGAGRPHRRHARRQAAADGVRRTRSTIVRPTCSSPISPARRTCSRAACSSATASSASSRPAAASPHGAGCRPT